jgi:DNA-binding transcriptional ArsR family regulator
MSYNQGRMLKLTYCQNCLHSLADPTRTKVIEFLAKKSPQTVNSIVAQFPLRQPTISHHLKMLKKEGFVTSEKKGNQIWYSLNLYCHKDESKRCYLLQNVSLHQKIPIPL